MLAILLAPILTIAVADEAKTADDYKYDGAFIGGTVLDIRKVKPKFALTRGQTATSGRADGHSWWVHFGGKPMKVEKVRLQYQDDADIANAGGFAGIVKSIADIAGEPSETDENTETAKWIGSKQTIVVMREVVRSVGGRRPLESQNGGVTGRTYVSSWIEVTPTERDEKKK